ncbi:DEAD/DEAH box helicase [Ilumatobacter coccineus]|uniref:DEAD/DEAH box helicase n=1 Tax=Ilumatobacter coccineus TaxID=467094 RepID=UPI000A02C2FF|nr:DEAD/DEAH box helicase [Ilumatobacter coccineus]
MHRSRHRPPYVAQATWRSGALHIWGWNGFDTASMAWMYSGFRKVGADGMRTGWHDSPISYGALGRISIDLPGQPAITSASVQLDPLGIAVWLSELPDEPEFVSDSVAWFARMAELARRTVSTGRVTPIITDEGPFTVARWVPALSDGPGEPSAIVGTLDALHAAKPYVCTAGSGHDTHKIFDLLVDGIARSTLANNGWKADLGRQRKPPIQALRATFGALSKPDHVVRGGTDEFDVAIGHLRDELDRHRQRLNGEPVLIPRLRLLMSDDPHDDWEVRIELVDDSDSLRWCTANDVWERSPTAIDVAGGEQHLDVLTDLIADLVTRVAPVIPGMADLAFEHEPTGVDLDLDAAEDFIDIAPFELEKLGIDLIGPEKLIRQSTRVTGEATPSPADDRKKQFGREALVEWKLVVGDEEISEAELTRAEEAGATLLHTGERWVRINADELRRKRDKVRDLQATKSKVTPLELLQLANDDDATEHETTITIRETGDTVDGTEIGSDFSDLGPNAIDWMRNLLDGLPDERLEEVVEASDFVGELRHYQRRGLGWMQFLAKLGLGGVLADDMGLGKTATTLAHLLERPGPHLVVCPLSVVRNWRTEANRFTPKLDVTVHHGNARNQQIEAIAAAMNVGDDGPDQMFAVDPERQLVITTYGLLPRDLEHLGAIDWTTVVLDEAQMVKNPNTKAARAVRQLRADQKLALTGTPVENRLSELWSILDATNTGMLGSLERFRKTYASPIERNHDPDAAARLRRVTGPFILRRTKADRRLLPDLPDKIEQIAYAKLTREQATLYQQVVDQLLHDAEQTSGMRRRGLVLAALMRLKQICNHPAHALKDNSRLAGRSGKLTRFDELVTDLLDNGERALVFTQFREMGDLLQRHVAEQFTFQAPFLHGGVSRSKRDQMVDEFQDGSGAPLLLVSLKAGGTGLNLTAASQVIHYDRWWNPAVEDQATDRAWRLGQTQTVNVHKLVCEGTIEEKVSQVIDDKRKLAEQVIGTGEGDSWMTELSTDDLRDLVVLEADGS